MSDRNQLRDVALALIDKGFEVRPSADVVNVLGEGGDVLNIVADDGAQLPPAVVEEIYWANFYAQTPIAGGSTFQAMLSTRADLPRNVIDLGCGDGRDTFAFARDGRRVLGIDRSQIAVDHATERAQRAGSLIRFAACDVGNVDELRPLLSSALLSDEPNLFYARFFLHSIPEDVQRTLLSTITALARPGDQLAAEFRTLQDETRPKVYGRHYRRYQDGPEFGRRLPAEYGFTVEYEVEQSGLSPFGDEDPVLYRVIARR